MKFAEIPALCAALFCATAVFAAPIRVVFDTDMGNDIDDALALSMLHRFQKEGKAEIAAVLVNKGAPAAPFSARFKTNTAAAGTFRSAISQTARRRNPGRSREKSPERKIRTVPPNSPFPNRRAAANFPMR